MKYVALLRGINVGGNNIIKMDDLRKVVEEAGFTNVKTYIQSGNVLFESGKNKETISVQLEQMLSKAFNYHGRVVVSTLEELKEVISNVPTSWKKNNDIRCYVAFVREPVTAVSVSKDLEINQEVDEVEIGKKVIYMTTKVSGLTRSGFGKLTKHKNYKDITIRNYNTTRKLLELMN